MFDVEIEINGEEFNVDEVIKSMKDYTETTQLLIKKLKEHTDFLYRAIQEIDFYPSDEDIYTLFDNSIMTKEEVMDDIEYSVWQIEKISSMLCERLKIKK